MQMAAISSTAPATLLVASAGTGKTRVLAARLAHIVRSMEKAKATPGLAPPKPGSVLVMSFTSAAAEQLCRQAAELPGLEHSGLGDSANKQVWRGTFHTFSTRLLSQYSYLGTGE